MHAAPKNQLRPVMSQSSISDDDEVPGTSDRETPPLSRPRRRWHSSPMAPISQETDLARAAPTHILSPIRRASNAYVHPNTKFASGLAATAYAYNNT